MGKMPTELQSARVLLVQSRPYLATAVFSLVPVERPGIGTMAVDRYWRLYYDPEVVEKWSVGELAGVLYHEVLHLLRNHPKRMETFPKEIANLAADAEINDDLEDEGVKLPGDYVTPEKLGLKRGGLAEEYLEELMKRFQQLQQRMAHRAHRLREQEPQNQQGQNQQGQGQQRSQQKRQSRQQSQQQSQVGQTSGKDNKQQGHKGNRKGNTDGNTSSSSSQRKNAAVVAGDGDEFEDRINNEMGEVSIAGNSNAGNATNGDEDCSQRGEGESQGQGDNIEASESEIFQKNLGDPIPNPCAGACGSCATGQPEPWEDPPPGTSPDAAPGKSETEAELIRREVAREIKAHVAKDPGSVPGHLKVWADEVLEPPKVDWRRELMAAIKRAIGMVAGNVDYTYRRVSRRQSVYGDEAILPGMYTPEPRVAVVLDTSGSMLDGSLQAAMSEIRGILKSLVNTREVTVLAVDTEVHNTKRIFSDSQIKTFNPEGGGGTDMGAGLKAATQLKPPPDVVIVLTDGYTPWPDEKPAGIKQVVVGLVGNHADPETVPKWAKIVVVDEKGKADRSQRVSTRKHLKMR